jgi:hypothetical protein
MALPHKDESLPHKKPATKKNGACHNVVVVLVRTKKMLPLWKTRKTRKGCNKLNAPNDDDPNPTTQLSPLPVVERDQERIEREIDEDGKMGRLGTCTPKSRATMAARSHASGKLRIG